MERMLLGSLLLLASGCMERASRPAPAPGAESAMASAAHEIRFPPGARLVDMTYVFDERTLYWPTSPFGFSIKSLHFGKTEGGFFYSANTLCAPEHGGTHLDAPLHFAEGKASADQVPLERLIAPAVVIDMSADAARDRDALLLPSHLDSFEREHGRIEPGTIVLIRTGWGKYWPDRKQYLGDDTPGEASHLHFPGISGDAARALVERKVAAVGIDTASIDHGPSKDFITHQTLMKADIPAFENVASLEQVPPRGALLLALPMKIGGGSGGPLRLVAVLPPR
ncbi:MAG: cyclase family protein [Archangium sp.]